MQKITLLIVAFITTHFVFAQPDASKIDKIVVPVVNEKQAAVSYATVELLRGKDSVLIKAGITDSLGIAVFQQIPNGVYLFA